MQSPLKKCPKKVRLVLPTALTASSLVWGQVCHHVGWEASRVIPSALLSASGLAAFVLVSSCFVRAEAAPTCPQHVNLRSRTQSFSYENLYCLSGGQIWVKSNEKNTGLHEDWHPFAATGVPSGPKIRSFGSDDCVKEIDQEATFLVALSCKGRYYLWKPTDLKDEPHWEEDVGAPFTGALRSVIGARDWTFSFSSAPSSDKILRMDPHNLDWYWEDVDGNKSEFGITATVYSLDHDGQTIRYWDTGLPNSFSRGFVTPDGGRFIAERLIASGSTILVIDAVGRMFTRMYDYEINTALPGVKVTYVRAHRTDDVLSLLGSVRTLPLPDWREQERIPLSGVAVVTRDISMHITGRGNAARELRVRGSDAAGRSGYWHKAIFDAQWEFTVTDEGFDEAEVIRDYGAAPVLGRVLAKDYSGKLSTPGYPDLDVSLVGFHYFNSPATLAVHTADGKVFDLLLHTADMWGLMPQEVYDPRQIGRPHGQPKLLYGTLIIPDSVLNSPDPEIQTTLRTYFLRFHLQTFALEIEADDAQVKINSQLLMRRPNQSGGSTKYLDFVVHSPIYATFQNVDPVATSADDPVPDTFQFIATSPELLIDDPEMATLADLPQLQRALELNQKALVQMAELRAHLRKLYLGAGLVNASATVVWALVDTLGELLGIQMWWPRNAPPGRDGLASAMVRGGDTFWRHARLDLRKALSDPDYRRSKTLVEDRIQLLQRTIERIRQKAVPTAP
jgi:hypothetical protein